MNKVARWIAIAAVIMGLISIGLYAAKRDWAKRTPDGMSKEQFASKESLDRLVSDLKKSLPAMIDKETELIDVGTEDGKIIYRYVLKNYSSDQIRPEQFLAALKSKVENGACREAKMRVFWINGVSAVYSYSTNDDRHIGDVVVTPSICGF